MAYKFQTAPLVANDELFRVVNYEDDVVAISVVVDESKATQLDDDFPGFLATGNLRSHIRGKICHAGILFKTYNPIFREWVYDKRFLFGGHISSLLVSAEA